MKNSDSKVLFFIIHDGRHKDSEFQSQTYPLSIEIQFRTLQIISLSSLYFFGTFENSYVILRSQKSIL